MQRWPFKETQQTGHTPDQQQEASNSSATKSGGAQAGVFLAALLESAVVPIPVEAIVAGHMLADLRRLWRLVLLATLGCLLGALAGYAAGALFFSTVGEGIIRLSHQEALFGQLQSQAQQWHLGTLLLVIGLAPVPFPVVAVVAGFSGYPVALFLLAVLLARGIRFILLGVLVHVFGERTLRWMQNGLSVDSLNPQQIRRIKCVWLTALWTISILIGLAIYVFG